MVQPQTTEGISDDGGGPSLPEELIRTRETLERLINEVARLNRRTTFNRVMVGGLAFLLVVVSGMGLYGYIYTHDEREKDRAERAAELVQFEETLRNGCENSVRTQANNRAELISLMNYLGARGGLPPEEIAAEIQGRIDEFNTINPPRDCAAEARARQAADSE